MQWFDLIAIAAAAVGLTLGALARSERPSSSSNTDSGDGTVAIMSHESSCGTLDGCGDGAGGGD